LYGAYNQSSTVKRFRIGQSAAKFLGNVNKKWYIVTPIVTYMINEEEIIKQYTIQKLSAAKISNNLNIDKKTVYRVLKRNNIPIRTLAQAAMQYTCNDDFFANIDSEKKAYWLGALFADGNVSQKASKSGQIFLTASDEDWVTNFMKAVESTNKPRTELHSKFKTLVWKAQITSKNMFKDLVSLGCVPAKSHIIKLPVLKDEFYSHFIRGYFDGDGSVGIYTNLKKSNWKILKSSICSGSEIFINQLLEKLPVNHKKITNKGVYIVQFSLGDTLRLYNYMYNNATVYLSRKRKVFDTYLKSYNPRKRFNDYNKLPLTEGKGIV
jgi:DNA-binding transcriptional regulator WhiA